MYISQGIRKSVFKKIASQKKKTNSINPISQNFSHFLGIRNHAYQTNSEMSKMLKAQNPKIVKFMHNQEIHHKKHEMYFVTHKKYTKC